MNFSKSLNYLLVLIGCIVAIYAQAGKEQNQYVLILGIIVLMLGIYRVSRTIPSKFEVNDNEQYDEEE